MKTAHTLTLMAAVTAGLCLGACSGTPGSMSRAAVSDLMNAETLAITPCRPAWLLEESEIHRLSPADQAAVHDILYRSRVRVVDEKYYRNAEEGNRGDTSTQIFYLYASNAQCMGGRVVPGKRVLMDDMTIEDADTQKLYSILLPYLRHLYPGLE